MRLTAASAGSPSKFAIPLSSVSVLESRVGAPSKGKLETGFLLGTTFESLPEETALARVISWIPSRDVMESSRGSSLFGQPRRRINLYTHDCTRSSLTAVGVKSWEKIQTIRALREESQERVAVIRRSS